MGKVSKYVLLWMFIAIVVPGMAQESVVSIYNPAADAKADIQAAIKKAVAENKQVLIQIGGNWCPWCLKLHNVFHNEPVVDSLIKSDYILIRVNFSKENKNLEVLKELGSPQRFGFPVLVVLDQNGNRIHTQDTGLLESATSYDVAKVTEFLKGWTRKALDPETYH